MKIIAMNSVEKQTAVIKLLRAEFQRERDSDFALLRHIPSTVVRKFLDYFSALNEAGKLALSEALAEKALCTFLPGEARNANSVAFQQYRASQLTMWDWKYLDVRMLRGILTTAKRHLVKEWLLASNTTLLRMESNSPSLMTVVQSDFLEVSPVHPKS